MLFSLTAFLVFVAALLASLLLYGKELKTRIVSAAGLCSLLVFLLSLIYIILSVAEVFGPSPDLINDLAVAALMNLYAGAFYIVVRAWRRFALVKTQGDIESEPSPPPVLRMPERYFKQDGTETKRFGAVGRG